MRMVSELRHRFQIRDPNLSVSSDREGGLDQTYTTLLTVWGGLKSITDNSWLTAAIRGVNASGDSATHEVKLRWIAVKSLGKAFSSGYSIGYKGMPDLNPIKSRYYLFKEEGSTVKGRLFKVIGVQRDEDFKEFVKIRVKEIEEQGTGYGGE